MATCVTAVRRRLDVLAEQLRAPAASSDSVSRCWQAADRYTALGLVDNPFRRQRFEPASFPYLSVRGPCLDEIVRAVAEAKAAEIVAPHGRGKSFLLEHLHRRFSLSEPTVLVSAERPLAVTARILRRRDVRWFVDRAERLPRIELGALSVLLRSGRRRAVLALHRSLGLRPLPAEPADDRLFAAVAREALRLDGIPPGILPDSAVAEAWALSGGNVRVGLGHLYRRFEDALCAAAMAVHST